MDLNSLISILLGGMAAGMVLFVVSVGLSVTMGLMGFVNLAHGGFAMLGGYAIVLSMRHWGLPFPVALAFGFVAIAGISVVFERLLYAPLYRARELDQVLLTIGLNFALIAAVTLGVGPETQTVELPEWLRGQTDLGLLQYRTYSLVLIAAGTALMLVLLFGFERTRIGARIRAAVDNRRMAQSMGVDVGRLFTLTFALGSGLAAVGGGLGAEILGLDPQYPFRYLAYFLIVVAVGGLGRISGVFFAAILIGVLDFVLKIYFPKGGTLFIYALTLILLLARPQGLFGEKGQLMNAQTELARRHRLQWWEALPWIAALACFFVFPDYLAFGTQVLVTILFALSLDLVLGYAGIVTLGHAAFFGAGAYTVGMMAMLWGWNEPLSGLLAAALVAGAIGLASGLVLLRTQGLALLMLTLCTMALLEQAANMGAEWTGGFDGMPGLSFGKILGLFGFDVLYYKSQYLYALTVLLVCFLAVRMLVYSSFGQSLTGIRENLLRMHAVGAPVRARQVIAYTISAALAGVAGALFAQANGYVNLAVLGLERSAGVMVVLILGGYGRLYGAFVGAIAYMLLEHVLAKAYPTAWQLGLGVTLIVVALFARDGVIGMFESLRRRWTGKMRGAAR